MIATPNTRTAAFDKFFASLDAVSADVFMHEAIEQRASLQDSSEHIVSLLDCIENVWDHWIELAQTERDPRLSHVLSDDDRAIALLMNSEERQLRLNALRDRYSHERNEDDSDDSSDDDSSDATPRKWTAEVSVAGQDVSDMLDLKHDTLRETTNAAVALAARLIREEFGSDASVVLFKQLSDDDEPQRDRSVYVYRADDGSIKTQRSGA